MLALYMIHNIWDSGLPWTVTFMSQTFSSMIVVRVKITSSTAMSCKLVQLDSLRTEINYWFTDTIIGNGNSIIVLVKIFKLCHHYTFY